MLTLAMETIMPTHPTLVKMGQQGVRVHPGRNKQWQERLERTLNRLNRIWFQYYAPVNPASNPQLQKLLYKTWGLPIQVRKGDGVTTDELACVNLREIVVDNLGGKDMPWHAFPECTPRTFDLILAIRRVSKDYKTYSKTKTDLKGYVYPSYLPESKDFENNSKTAKRKGATATGRLASYNPNFQNQSFRAKYMYIPDHPDFAFGQLDYSGAELWIMAIRSNDPVMLADLKTGDLHGVGAKAIGCERKTYKAVIFGTMYGAGPAKISDTIKKQDGIFIHVSECKRIQNEIAKRYNRMWAFRQAISNAVVAKGYVKNPFGRIRFYYNGSKDIPSALDYIPQSTVADILWSILKPVSECAERFGGRLTTTVHDSVLIQAPERVIKEAVRECKRIMEREFPQIAAGFFIPVECEIGDAGASWGELKKWKSNED